jgi:hypothetical protein
MALDQSHGIRIGKSLPSEKQLDQEYEAQACLKAQLSKDVAPVKISSNLRT